jgi:hypothetical protein
MKPNGKSESTTASNTHRPDEDSPLAVRPANSLDNVIDPAPACDAILQMQTGLFHLAHNRAVLSGAVKPNPEDIRSLEEHARSIARDTYRDEFDPKKNVHDRMHQAEYERLLGLRDEIENGVGHAAANVREAEMALANSPKAGAKPQANAWLAAAFIVAITVTIAPTLHDFLFFGIPDEMLAWFGSSACAAFVASMLTLAILSGRRTRWEWVGVAAGIVLGLGLGTLRLSSAKGTGEVLFALGLTVVEVSAVLLLEWLASGLRSREDEWRVIKQAEDKAVGLRDAAVADLARRQTHAKEVSDQIGRKIAYVEDRSHRSLHLPELEAVAVKTVVDGYNAGVAENVGRLRGAMGRVS